METLFEVLLSRYSSHGGNSRAADTLSYLFQVMACVSAMKEAPLLSI